MLLYSQQLNCEPRPVLLPQQTRCRREKFDETGHTQGAGAFQWEQKHPAETTYLCNKIHTPRNRLI